MITPIVMAAMLWQIGHQTPPALKQATTVEDVNPVSQKLGAEGQAGCAQIHELWINSEHRDRPALF